MNANRLVPLAVLLLAAACGYQQEHYDTAAMARKMGAAQRGLLPPFVADGARNVHLVNDTKDGRVWVWCDLDRRAESEMQAQVRAVGWSEARATTTTPPFNLNFPEWNPVLGGRLTYTPAAGALYFVSGPWHGIVNPGGRCWITLTAHAKPRNLRGHMLHRIPTQMGRMVMRRPGA